MNLFGWLNFLKPKRVPRPEARISREIVVRIAKKSEDLQESLKVYQRAKDPLSALIADVYNKDQLSRSYLNGRG